MYADALILNVLGKVAGPVPAAKLVQLVYLVDCVHYQHYGDTATGFRYQWDHSGPVAVGDAVISAAEKLATEGQLNYQPKSNRFGLPPGTSIEPLDARVEMALGDVVHHYGRLSVEQITAETRKTGPFKKATQHGTLKMEHSLPALSATEGDSWAYYKDLEENGAVSLEEVNKAYGL